MSGIPKEDQACWKAVILQLESVPDAESEWAFVEKDRAIEQKFFDKKSMVGYEQAIKPDQYTCLNNIKKRLYLSYKSTSTPNSDALRDFKTVFSNAVRYFWDPKLSHRRNAWAMLQTFDQAVAAQPLLVGHLANEGTRFAPYYDAFPGAAPVIKMLEKFHNDQLQAEDGGTYWSYFRDGFYHPEDNYQVCTIGASSCQVGDFCVGGWLA